MIHDTMVPDFKEIRGRGRILVPEIKAGKPTGNNIVLDVIKGVGLVPLSKVNQVRQVSRKHIIRKARAGDLSLYDFDGNILPRDDKTSVTKFANYYELKGSS
ncbi:MAG: hypothetical protein RIE52_12140 [Balneola sp.]